jgi:signal transduction histidine kinase
VNDSERVSSGASSRRVLRFGYAAVIGLLVISTVWAYHIEGIASGQRVELYRQFVKQDEAISQLRRAVWLASNDVRDFFLSSLPDRSTQLKSQVQALEAQSSGALQQLNRGTPENTETRFLKTHLREYWSKLEPVPESMSGLEAAAAYRFIQREIVPRRNALYDAFQQITESNQAALQKSEVAYADKRQDAVRRLLLMLGLCVVLGLLVAGVSLRHASRLERETARQYAEVARAKRDMEHLSARLLETEEDSRRWLSRELHDEIGQTLAVLEIELSHAHSLTDETQPGIRDRLRRARDLAEKTVQTVRNISLLLRPALLDDLGLTPALQWLLEDFERRSGVACEFAEEGVQDLLPDSVKTCVYRVVQEALHNCEKHAGASQVRVTARQGEAQVQVEIEDNGRGLELDSKGMPGRNAGLGILGMRERAARVGGALTLDSSPGRGTRICLRIPLADLTVSNSKTAASEAGVGA